MSRKFVYGLIGFLLFGSVSMAVLLSYFTQISDSKSMVISIIVGMIGAWLGFRIANRLNNSIPSGESNTSLRWWFIILGLFGISAIFNTGAEATTIITFSLPTIISLIFSLITLYIGFSYNNLIKNNSKFIINFLFVEIAYSIVYAILKMMSTQENSSGMAIGVVAGIMIQIYIIVNIKKLSSSR